jgi:hypothetical protein
VRGTTIFAAAPPRHLTHRSLREPCMKPGSPSTNGAEEGARDLPFGSAPSPGAIASRRSGVIAYTLSNDLQLWPSGKHVKFVLVVSMVVLGFELDANAEFFALNFHELATLHPSPQQPVHPRKHFIPSLIQLRDVQACYSLLNLALKTAKIDR